MNRQVRFLQIEPTTRCNFNCHFCIGRQMPQRDMGVEIFENIIQLFPEIEHIELQGEGEPLLNPHFFEMVAAAKRHRPNVRISFITNGSLFNQQNIEKILECDISKIYVSIESTKPETYHEIRGGILTDIIQGIQSLMDKRNSQKRHLPLIGFAVTILRKTMYDYPSICRLYSSLGMDGGIISQPLQRMSVYTRFYNKKVTNQMLTNKDVNYFNQHIHHDPMIQKIVNQPSRVRSFKREMASHCSNPLLECAWLQEGCYVTVDGKATSCHYNKGFDGSDFGIINKDSINDIIRKRNTMREQLQMGMIPSVCSDCNKAK